MDGIKDKIRAYANEKPVETMVVGAMVVSAAAKLIDAISSARGRAAYARQVNYRIKTRK